MGNKSSRSNPRQPLNHEDKIDNLPPLDSSNKLTYIFPETKFDHFCNDLCNIIFDETLTTEMRITLVHRIFHAPENIQFLPHLSTDPRYQTQERWNNLVTYKENYTTHGDTLLTFFLRHHVPIQYYSLLTHSIPKEIDPVYVIDSVSRKTDPSNGALLFHSRSTVSQVLFETKQNIFTLLWFFEHGANMFAKNQVGSTLLSFAFECSFFDVNSLSLLFHYALTRLCRVSDIYTARALDPARYPDIELFPTSRSVKRSMEYQHCHLVELQLTEQPINLRGDAYLVQSTQKCISIPLHSSSPSEGFLQFMNEPDVRNVTPILAAALFRAPPAVLQLLMRFGSALSDPYPLAIAAQGSPLLHHISDRSINDKAFLYAPNILGSTSLHRHTHATTAFVLSVGQTVPRTACPSRFYRHLILYYQTLMVYPNFSYFSPFEALLDHPNYLIRSFFSGGKEHLHFRHFLPSPAYLNGNPDPFTAPDYKEIDIAASSYFKQVSPAISGLSAEFLWDNQYLIPFLVDYNLWYEFGTATQRGYNLLTSLREWGGIDHKCSSQFEIYLAQVVAALSTLSPTSTLGETLDDIDLEPEVIANNQKKRANLLHQRDLCDLFNINELETHITTLESSLNHLNPSSSDDEFSSQLTALLNKVSGTYDIPITETLKSRLQENILFDPQNPESTLPYSLLTALFRIYGAPRQPLLSLESYSTCNAHFLTTSFTNFSNNPHPAAGAFEIPHRQRHLSMRGIIPKQDAQFDGLLDILCITQPFSYLRAQDRSSNSTINPISVHTKRSCLQRIQARMSNFSPYQPFPAHDFLDLTELDCLCVISSRVQFVHFSEHLAPASSPRNIGYNFTNPKDPHNNHWFSPRSISVHLPTSNTINNIPYIHTIPMLKQDIHSPNLQFEFSKPHSPSHNHTASTPGTFLYQPSLRDTYGAVSNFSPQNPPGLLWYLLLFSTLNVDDILLIIQTCRVDIVNQFYQTPLMYMMIRQAPQQCILAAMRKSQNINQQDIYARTVMHYYTMCAMQYSFDQDIDPLLLLLHEGGALLDVLDVYNNTSLTYGMWVGIPLAVFNVMMEMMVTYTPKQYENYLTTEINVNRNALGCLNHDKMGMFYKRYDNITGALYDRITKLLTTEQNIKNEDHESRTKNMEVFFCCDDKDICHNTMILNKPSIHYLQDTLLTADSQLSQPHQDTDGSTQTSQRSTMIDYNKIDFSLSEGVVALFKPKYSLPRNLRFISSLKHSPQSQFAIFRGNRLNNLLFLTNRMYNNDNEIPLYALTPVLERGNKSINGGSTIFELISPYPPHDLSKENMSRLNNNAFCFAQSNAGLRRFKDMQYYPTHYSQLTLLDILIRTLQDQSIIVHTNYSIISQTQKEIQEHQKLQLAYEHQYYTTFFAVVLYTLRLWFFLNADQYNQKMTAFDIIPDKNKNQTDESPLSLYINDMIAPAFDLSNPHVMRTHALIMSPRTPGASAGKSGEWIAQREAFWPHIMDTHDLTQFSAQFANLAYSVPSQNYIVVSVKDEIKSEKLLQILSKKAGYIQRFARVFRLTSEKDLWKHILTVYIPSLFLFNISAPTILEILQSNILTASPTDQVSSVMGKTIISKHYQYCHIGTTRFIEVWADAISLAVQWFDEALSSS